MVEKELKTGTVESGERPEQAGGWSKPGAEGREPRAGSGGPGAEGRGPRAGSQPRGPGGPSAQDRFGGMNGNAGSLPYPDKINAKVSSCTVTPWTSAHPRTKQSRRLQSIRSRTPRPPQTSKSGPCGDDAEDS